MNEIKISFSSVFCQGIKERGKINGIEPVFVTGIALAKSSSFS